MEKYYLTTAIDYVNGAPHIGHAYEKILTDIIARHYSQRCDDVFFLTGTDEHGIKIQKTADQRAVDRKTCKLQRSTTGVRTSECTKTVYPVFRRR